MRAANIAPSAGADASEAGQEGLTAQLAEHEELTEEEQMCVIEAAPLLSSAPVT